MHTGAVYEQANSVSPSAVFNAATEEELRHSPLSPFRQGSSAWNNLTLQSGSQPTLPDAAESSRQTAHLGPPASARFFDHGGAGPSPLAPPASSTMTLSPLATLSLPPHCPSIQSPEGLTVGQYLTSFPTSLHSPEQPPSRPLRRSSGGEFETEVSILVLYSQDATGGQS